MLKKYCDNMKIKNIKTLLLMAILLPNIILGQEIKISYDGESSAGGILFSLSSVEDNGEVAIKTDGIFSNARLVNMGPEQGVIASIDIMGYKPDKTINYLDQIWLFLNDELRVVFQYPVGTKSAYGLNDGVTLFSYDRHCNIVGAVDSIGNIIMPPKYEYIIKHGRFLNGINLIYDDSTDDIKFKCRVFKQGSTEPNYTYDVFFDNRVPIYITIHNPYSKLISNKSFSDMLQEMEYDSDTQLYLSGIHELLNLNYTNALLHFNQIDNKDSFKYLRKNINQCLELISFNFHLSNSV